MRKAELIGLIQNNQWNTNPPLQSWEPNRLPRTNRPPQPPPTQTWELIDDRLRPELEAPLTKRQCKRRHAKDAKLAKRFTNLNSEIDNLKLRMEELKEKMTCTSRFAHSGFKRKRIRSMKREADKIATQLAEAKRKLESIMGPPIRGPIQAPPNRHPPSRSK